MKKVLITTGGTGGHLYPALAVASKLKERGVECFFAGSKYRMEKDIIPDNKYRFYGLPVIPFNKPISIFRLIESTVMSYKMIKKENPDAIIGFGNYITVPVIAAGLLLRKKIYLHEQNVKIGLANKLFYRFAAKTFLSYDTTFEAIAVKFHPKLMVSGNPVREAFHNVDSEAEREKLKFEKNEKMILIWGGSLGAKSINDAVMKKWDKVFQEKNIRIYWATGKTHFTEINEKISKLKKNDTIKPYFENVPSIMAAANLVVGRAGGSTIAELLVLSKPSIIIPSGNAKTGQYDNPKMLMEAGGCEIFEDKDVDEAIERAFELIKDDEALKKMGDSLKGLRKENSVEKIVDELDIWRN